MAERRCPYCEALLVHCKKLPFPGTPASFPIPCTYECDGCGYMEEAPPFTAADVRRLIHEHFRDRERESPAAPSESD